MKCSRCGRLMTEFLDYKYKNTITHYWSCSCGYRCFSHSEIIKEEMTKWPKSLNK